MAMSAEQKATQADALAFRRSGDPGELLLCLRMEQSAERLGLLGLAVALAWFSSPTVIHMIQDLRA
jgi:hypothetical protein